MENKLNFDFAALREGRIRQDELASLMEVSRVTANGWVGGKPVHKARHKKLHTYLTAFRSAIDNAKLPLEHGMSNDDRMVAVKSILVDYINSQKQA